MILIYVLEFQLKPLQSYGQKTKIYKTGVISFTMVPMLTVLDVYNVARNLLLTESGVHLYGSAKTLSNFSLDSILLDHVFLTSCLIYMLISARWHCFDTALPRTHFL